MNQAPGHQDLLNPEERGPGATCIPRGTLPFLHRQRLLLQQLWEHAFPVIPGILLHRRNRKVGPLHHQRILPLDHERLQGREVPQPGLKDEATLLGMRAQGQDRVRIPCEHPAPGQPVQRPFPGGIALGEMVHKQYSRPGLTCDLPEHPAQPGNRFRRVLRAASHHLVNRVEDDQ